MIRVLLLLLIVASSCQQKKRGVVCERVDATSGQCTQQLLSGEVKTEPEDPDPTLPELIKLFDRKKISSDDNKIDETPLKDITIKSECKNSNGRCSVFFTCRVVPECGSNNLVEFTADDKQEDAKHLCTEDTINVSSEASLECGSLDTGNPEVFSSKAEENITPELLSQGACIKLSIVQRAGTTTSISLRPTDGCMDSSIGSTFGTSIIELTFYQKI